jgi:hypothetical protein
MGNAFPWEVFIVRQPGIRQEKFTQMPGARLVIKTPAKPVCTRLRLVANHERQPTL